VSGSGSTRVSLRIAFCLSMLVALGLVAAGSAGAVTITSWTGGKSSVPTVITAAGACPGTVVTINGTGFVNDGGIVSVTIGGVPAGEVVVGTDTLLFARTGAGATSGPIVVTTKAGTATATPNAIVWPCQSTGVATAAPVIQSVAPQRAKSGRLLTLTGNGFVGATSVTVDGASAAYAIPSDIRLYVRVPAGAKAGLLTIVVTNNKGSAKVVFQKVG
jgi:IPT/TIG domain-containing protein